MDELQSLCEQAARAGGAVLLDWRDRFQAREKGPADLVTEADLASQDVIRETVLGVFPEHGFLAEESAAIIGRDAAYRWIVDPLDGTTNYVHGVPNYCVSIAVEGHGRLLAGTVFNPVTDECFSAAAGGGALLNGTRIHVSRASELSQALVAACFPAHVQRDDPVIAAFVEVLVRARAIRRMGSAALNLCYLAAGRFDAYYSSTTKPWDIAAGALIVQEAGGMVTDLEGQALNVDRGRFVAASTRALGEELREAISPARL